jgi:hypothetical protein
MTTYNTTAKNTTSYSTVNRSDLTTTNGTAIGLLLALTYSGQGASYTVYTPAIKNITSYTTTNKN